MTLRALVVDDERLSRLAMRQLLAAAPDVELVAECRGIAEAEPMLSSVDVAFLDIEMPQRSGLAAARSWESGGATVPFIVFVTAFEHYALPAFDAAAVDYLTKPVRPARLAKALERVRTRLRERAGPLATELAERPARPAPLVTRVGDSDVVIPIERIDCIEADGVYAGVWMDQRRLLVRVSLDALEERLAPVGFARVHRSWLVPVDRIAAMKPIAQSRGRALLLTSGRSVPVSRRRLSSVRRTLDAQGRLGPSADR